MSPKRNRRHHHLFSRRYRPLGVDLDREATVAALDVRSRVAVAAVVDEGVGVVQDGAVGGALRENAHKF